MGILKSCYLEKAAGQKLRIPRWLGKKKASRSSSPTASFNKVTRLGGLGNEQLPYMECIPHGTRNSSLSSKCEQGLNVSDS